MFCCAVLSDVPLSFLEHAIMGVSSVVAASTIAAILLICTIVSFVGSGRFDIPGL